MTAANFEHYPKNVGILAMEMYFPHRVSIQTGILQDLFPH